MSSGLIFLSALFVLAVNDHRTSDDLCRKDLCSGSCTILERLCKKKKKTGLVSVVKMEKMNRIKRDL